MHKSRIEGDLVWADFVILRLLRRWAAARTMGDNALPNLVEMAVELGESAEAAISLHSVFQLTESCLGRSLRAECCCSRSIAPDERAILSLMAIAPPQGPPFASSEVPHGLPGALWWALRSAHFERRGAVNGTELPISSPASGSKQGELRGPRSRSKAHEELAKLYEDEIELASDFPVHEKK